MVENQNNLSSGESPTSDAESLRPLRQEDGGPPRQEEGATSREEQENQLAPPLGSDAGPAPAGEPSPERAEGEPSRRDEDLEETAEFVRPTPEDAPSGEDRSAEDAEDGQHSPAPQEAAELEESDELEEGDEEDEEPPVPPSGPIELIEDEDEDLSMDWYILKVQSNRERSIAAALERKVAIEGLDRFFGQILVPTEKVTEFKGGKKKVVERKVWPGYIAVEMHVNDDTWFAIRETSGIGDFTGAGGKPTPMAPQDVAKILHTEEEETDEAPKLAIPFKEGDKVKVKEGNFESFEGDVSKIDEVHGKVTVMLSIFGRPTPVELEYWQVELV